MTLPAAIAAAAWLGILTSMSPCPLATNVAAISYLGRRMHSRGMALAGGAAYAVGRAAVYALIGLLIGRGLASAPELSVTLQNEVGPFMGPVLILVGLVLLGWISLPVNFSVAGHATASRLAAFGVLGEFLIGALFALTFCPVSAALFFGALLPLALSSTAPLLPLVAYGIGTALPVAFIAISLALGLSGSRTLITWTQGWQPAVQTTTATVILLIALYLTLTLTFGWTPAFPG